ncbi:hypothetical protein Taro_022518 [Colocasia esculenta]|uniref:Uncharacterized protein n=1 Tax=Colocasia esculenta TaxID=4460 RepID=A0A843VBI9_COLES|nr:hypothetical protein [Colocasia esculenta]
MLSSPFLRLPVAPLHGHPFVAASGHPAAQRSRDLAGPCRGANREVLSSASSPSASLAFPRALRKSVPLAASAAILLWSHPVDAGILSGFSGLESIPGPELPQIDFLKRWSDEKQKKYEELDSRFKSSPVLKELLEKSRSNKAR